MTSDPYADTASADPYGARSMQTAIDRLVAAMAEKMKAFTIGIPGPDPAIIEVHVDDDGLDIAVKITIPLGITREAMGYLTTTATTVVGALPLGPEVVTALTEPAEPAGSAGSAGGSA